MHFSSITSICTITNITCKIVVQETWPFIFLICEHKTWPTDYRSQIHRCLLGLFYFLNKPIYSFFSSRILTFPLAYLAYLYVTICVNYLLYSLCICNGILFGYLCLTCLFQSASLFVSSPWFPVQTNACMKYTYSKAIIIFDLFVSIIH